jgi:hypothetical protein
MLSISADVYHQKTIPLESVKNAARAADELGRFFTIAVCTHSKDDPEYLAMLDEVRALAPEDRIRTSTTLPVGRAGKTRRRSDYHTAPDPPAGACSMASWPVVFPDGGVVACIGPLLTLPRTHPMYLGDLHREPLADVLDRAETNPVLHAIRSWGPGKLVAFLKEHGASELLPSEYICDCPCDVCYKLLSDQRIVKALAGIVEGKEIRDTIAYARMYYLREPTMVELYGIGEAEAPGPDA